MKHPAVGTAVSATSTSSTRTAGGCKELLSAHPTASAARASKWDRNSRAATQVHEPWQSSPSPTAAPIPQLPSPAARASTFGPRLKDREGSAVAS